MSTAEHPDALTRRIEQLAAASQDEPEGAAVAALVGALHTEIGFVRAELDSLRSETGAVRSETGTLVRHVAELGTRIDGVGGRVDGAVSSVLARGTETAAVAQSALEDARGALESRMAVLEDALDALSERIEALARDGASTTTDLLGTLTTTVHDLDKRIGDEGRDSAELLVGRLRDVTETQASELEDTLFDRLSNVLRIRDDELRRDVLGALQTARGEAAENRTAVSELAATVRGALDGFGAALDRSASGLGASVTGALAEGRNETRAELDEVVERLSGAVVALRTELVARDDVAVGQMSGLQSSIEGRVEGVRSQLTAAMTVLRSDVATETGTLTALLDGVAVAGTANGEALRAVMADARTEVTEVTRALREDLLARIEGQYAAVADRLAGVTAEVTGATVLTREGGERLSTLSTASDDVRRTLDELRGNVAELAEALEDRTSRLSVEVLGRLGGLEATVDSGLMGVGGRVDRVGATVDQNKDSTREAGQRLLLLADTVRAERAELGALLEAVRGDVVGATRDLREELITRSSEQLGSLADKLALLDTTVDGTAADVRHRLAELDVAVGLSSATTERSAESLGALADAHDGLIEVIEGFRAEWPTRTFEVVQGAKAVAETVVRDVRTEIEVQLAQVREVLARAADEVEGARDGLDAGTDRLSRAGKVLVAYLEQRDLLLEAERDRVLHDILESFADGLSTRERSALASRFGDIVHRRRDARDAKRYRSAVGQPTSPVVDVPGEVTRLVPEDAAAAAAAREARLRRAEAARPPEAPSAARGALAAPVSPAKRPAKTVRAAPSARPPLRAGAAGSPAAKTAISTKKATSVNQASPAKKAAPSENRAPAKRAAPAKEPGSAKTAWAAKAVAPARKAAPATAPAKEPSSKKAPVKVGRPTGRLADMPAVPGVGVALAAAASPLEQPVEPPPAVHQVREVPAAADSVTQDRPALADEPAEGGPAEHLPAAGVPVEAVDEATEPVQAQALEPDPGPAPDPAPESDPDPAPALEPDPAPVPDPGSAPATPPRAPETSWGSRTADDAPGVDDELEANEHRRLFRRR